MNKPTIGRIVIYNTSKSEREAFQQMGKGNMQEKLPAVIVAVWSDTLVNLKVLTDGTEDLWRTSVSLGDDWNNWNWPVIEKVD